MTGTINRRRSPRAAVGVVVHTEFNEVAVALGQSRDISCHGLFVDLVLLASDDHDFANGRTLTLRFTIPGTDKPVEVAANVTRVVVGEDRPIGIGVEFVSLDRG